MRMICGLHTASATIVFILVVVVSLYAQRLSYVLYYAVEAVFFERLV